EQVLPALPVLTVRCHGFVEDPDGQGCWLFLEDAGGEEYLPSSALDRALAGRWLGLLHASGTRLAAGSRQPDLGPHHYLDHLPSAHATLLLHLTNPALTGEDVGVLREVVRQCEVIVAHWGDVQRVCAGLPRTFVHGDFAPKNVRVRVGTRGPTLVPFDWGSAGWGVPAADLVQAGSAPDHGTDWSYWASPDLAAYCSEARQAWPRLDLQDLQEVAVLGKVFRLLVCISLDARSFATEWVERAMRNMRIYHAQLTCASLAAGWPAWATAGGRACDFLAADHCYRPDGRLPPGGDDLALPPVRPRPGAPGPRRLLRGGFGARPVQPGGGGAEPR